MNTCKIRQEWLTPDEATDVLRQHNITLLRLAPAMIWEQPEQRPACFTGSLIMATGEIDNTAARIEKPALLTGQKNNPSESDQASNEGERFLAWLRIGVMQPDRVNTKTAYVHLVNDNVFLVTPGIFKLYTKETTGSGDNDWQRAQKGFQSLGLHRRGQEGENIWICEVKAPGKVRPLKGFLVTGPQTIVGENIPVNNPWLKLTPEAG